MVQRTLCIHYLEETTVLQVENWFSKYNISVAFLKLKIFFFEEYIRILYHLKAEAALQIPVVFEVSHLV